MGVLRKDLREQSARYLNSLSRDELFERFLITRVANITGMDSIGIPVYSAARPAACRIAVSAGKSMDPLMARAGAIAEGIEFHTFEFARTDSIVAPFDPQDWDMPTSKDSTWTPETPIAQEEVIHWASGKVAMMPSSLIWMDKRRQDAPGNRAHFMSTSNGNATGYSFLDAFTQGVCELVERDQCFLRYTSLKRLVIYPPMVDTDMMTGQLRELVGMVELSGCKMYLFHCTYDIQIPAYWAILVDREEGIGQFGGYGCHINSCVAAMRAMLEAVQSRAVYISGARDDILRRDFYYNKYRSAKLVMSELDPIERTAAVPFSQDAELTCQEEFDLVIQALGPWADKLYYKHFDLKDGIHVIKAFIPGLEQPIMGEDWRPMRWQKLVEAEEAALNWAQPLYW